MPRKCVTCSDDIVVGKIITDLDNGLQEVEILTECLYCRILRRTKNEKRDLLDQLKEKRRRLIYLEERLNLRKIKNQRGTYSKYCEERYAYPDNFEDF